MEIAFFSDSYLPHRDGTAAVVGGLARALERQGHGVRVYTSQSIRGPTERTVDAGIPVTRLRSVPVPQYGEYRWALLPFGRLRNDHFSNVDVVHLHTPGIMGTSGFFAARRYRKPLIGTFHTNVWEMRESFPQSAWIRLFFRVAWWYNLGLYWRCALTTAPTESAKVTLEGAARKPFRRPIQVVPNGIESERFHPGIQVPDWREAVGLPHRPLITFLGRLTLDKGVHRFLDALKELPTSSDYVAIIGGTGPEAAAIAARLAHTPSLREHVRFVGPVPEESKAALLAQSDLFVLPSTSDTSSIALLEAMACGATCVVSDVGGPKELIDDGVTGRIFPVATPGGLTETLSDLLAAPDQRTAMGRAAVDHVRATASIDAIARRFISLYELLREERGPSADRIAG